MPVKVLDQTGSGNTANIANGIAYAVANGAKVINMSLGIPITNDSLITSDASMDPQIVNAHSQGVVVVAAAGNEGYEFGVSYPAIHPNVIAVGATGISNEKAVYTNYGDGLDIYAPGGNSGYPNPNSNSYVWQEMYYEGSWGPWGLQGTSSMSQLTSLFTLLLLCSYLICFAYLLCYFCKWQALT
jgi:serine protease